MDALARLLESVSFAQGHFRLDVGVGRLLLDFPSVHHRSIVAVCYGRPVSVQQTPGNNGPFPGQSHSQSGMWIAATMYH